MFFFCFFQSSPESDYNNFLENLVNKRRQIADANPKNLTHFSGNSMSSSVPQNPQSPINAVNSGHLNPELRATKSIIIGAGQPIVVPGQRQIDGRSMNANAALKTASNQMLPIKSVNNEANAGGGAAIRPHVDHTAVAVAAAAGAPVRASNNDGIGGGKVTSVEEFCPDGGALQGFLDDLPAISTDGRQADLNYDSDSDSNDTGNPLVAKFHDDPFDDDVASSIPKAQTTKAPSKAEPKVNPLAKKQNKQGIIPHDLGLVMPSKQQQRRSSNSSDDIEIPYILKTKTNNDNSSDGQSNEEFDSWLSDTNQRRSPEGGEDEASLPSIDKSIAINAEINKLTRLQLNDGDGNVDDGEKATKDKSSKSKKKKKEKKEKKEKSDKEKKRSKSKKYTAEDLLIEAKDHLSHTDRQNTASDVDANGATATVDDQYEAL